MLLTRASLPETRRPALKQALQDVRLLRAIY
jgi:hypothetical protein